MFRHMMRDLLHPSPTGYRIWAQAIEPDLAAMLGEKPVNALACSGLKVNHSMNDFAPSRS